MLNESLHNLGPNSKPAFFHDQATIDQIAKIKTIVRDLGTKKVDESEDPSLSYTLKVKIKVSENFFPLQIKRLVLWVDNPRQGTKLLVHYNNWTVLEAGDCPALEIDFIDQYLRQNYPEYFEAAEMGFFLTESSKYRGTLKNKGAYQELIHRFYEHHEPKLPPAELFAREYDDMVPLRYTPQGNEKIIPLELVRLSPINYPYAKDDIRLRVRWTTPEDFDPEDRQSTPINILPPKNLVVVLEAIAETYPAELATLEEGGEMGFFVKESRQGFDVWHRTVAYTEHVIHTYGTDERLVFDPPLEFDGLKHSHYRVSEVAVNTEHEKDIVVRYHAYLGQKMMWTKTKSLGGAPIVDLFDERDPVWLEAFTQALVARFPETQSWLEGAEMGFFVKEAVQRTAPTMAYVEHVIRSYGEDDHLGLDPPLEFEEMGSEDSQRRRHFRLSSLTLPSSLPVKDIGFSYQYYYGKSKPPNGETVGTNQNITWAWLDTTWSMTRQGSLGERPAEWLIALTQALVARFPETQSWLEGAEMGFFLSEAAIFEVVLDFAPLRTGIALMPEIRTRLEALGYDIFGIDGIDFSTTSYDSTGRYWVVNITEKRVTTWYHLPPVYQEYPHVNVQTEGWEGLLPYLEGTEMGFFLSESCPPNFYDKAPPTGVEVYFTNTEEKEALEIQLEGIDAELEYNDADWLNLEQGYVYIFLTDEGIYDWEYYDQSDPTRTHLPLEELPTWLEGAEMGFFLSEARTEDPSAYRVVKDELSAKIKRVVDILGTPHRIRTAEQHLLLTGTGSASGWTQWDIVSVGDRCFTVWNDQHWNLADRGLDRLQALWSQLLDQYPAAVDILEGDEMGFFVKESQEYLIEVDYDAYDGDLDCMDHALLYCHDLQRWLLAHGYQWRGIPLGNIPIDYSQFLDHSGHLALNPATKEMFFLPYGKTANLVITEEQLRTMDLDTLAEAGEMGFFLKEAHLSPLPSFTLHLGSWLSKEANREAAWARLQSRGYEADPCTEPPPRRALVSYWHIDSTTQLVKPATYPEGVVIKLVDFLALSDEDLGADLWARVEGTEMGFFVKENKQVNSPLLQEFALLRRILAAVFKQVQPPQDILSFPRLPVIRRDDPKNPAWLIALEWAKWKGTISSRLEFYYLEIENRHGMPVRHELYAIRPRELLTYLDQTYHINKDNISAYEEGTEMGFFVKEGANHQPDLQQGRDEIQAYFDTYAIPYLTGSKELIIQDPQEDGAIIVKRLSRNQSIIVQCADYDHGTWKDRAYPLSSLETPDYNEAILTALRRQYPEFDYATYGEAKEMGFFVKEGSEDRTRMMATIAKWIQLMGENTYPTLGVYQVQLAEPIAYESRGGGGPLRAYRALALETHGMIYILNDVPEKDKQLYGTQLMHVLAEAEVRKFYEALCRQFPDLAEADEMGFFVKEATVVESKDIYSYVKEKEAWIAKIRRVVQILGTCTGKAWTPVDTPSGDERHLFVSDPALPGQWEIVSVGENKVYTLFTPSDRSTGQQRWNISDRMLDQIYDLWNLIIAQYPEAVDILEGDEMGFFVKEALVLERQRKLPTYPFWHLDRLLKEYVRLHYRAWEQLGLMVTVEDNPHLEDYPGLKSTAITDYWTVDYEPTKDTTGAKCGETDWNRRRDIAIELTQVHTNLVLYQYHQTQFVVVGLDGINLVGLTDADLKKARWQRKFLQDHPTHFHFLDEIVDPQIKTEFGELWEGSEMGFFVKESNQYHNDRQVGLLTYIYGQLPKKKAWSGTPEEYEHYPLVPPLPLWIPLDTYDLETGAVTNIIALDLFEEIEEGVPVLCLRYHFPEFDPAQYESTRDINSISKEGLQTIIDHIQRRAKIDTRAYEEGQEMGFFVKEANAAEIFMNQELNKHQPIDKKHISFINLVVKTNGQPTKKGSCLTLKPAFELEPGRFFSKKISALERKQGKVLVSYGFWDDREDLSEMLASDVQKIYEEVSRRYPDVAEAEEMGFFVKERLLNDHDRRLWFGALDNLFTAYAPHKSKWTLDREVQYNPHVWNATKLYTITAVEKTKSGYFKVQQLTPSGKEEVVDLKAMPQSYVEDVTRALTAAYPEYGEAKEMGFLVKEVNAFQARKAKRDLITQVLLVVPPKPITPPITNDPRVKVWLLDIMTQSVFGTPWRIEQVRYVYGTWDLSYTDLETGETKVQYLGTCYDDQLIDPLYTYVMETYPDLAEGLEMGFFMKEAVNEAKKPHYSNPLPILKQTVQEYGHSKFMPTTGGTITSLMLDPPVILSYNDGQEYYELLELWLQDQVLWAELWCNENLEDHESGLTHYTFSLDLANKNRAWEWLGDMVRALSKRYDLDAFVEGSEMGFYVKENNDPRDVAVLRASLVRYFKVFQDDDVVYFEPPIRISATEVVFKLEHDIDFLNINESTLELFWEHDTGWISSHFLKYADLVTLSIVAATIEARHPGWEEGSEMGFYVKEMGQPSVQDMSTFAEGREMGFFIKEHQDSWETGVVPFNQAFIIHVAPDYQHGRYDLLVAMEKKLTELFGAYEKHYGFGNEYMLYDIETREMIGFAPDLAANYHVVAVETFLTWGPEDLKGWAEGEEMGFFVKESKEYTISERTQMKNLLLQIIETEGVEETVTPAQISLEGHDLRAPHVPGTPFRFNHQKSETVIRAKKLSFQPSLRVEGSFTRIYEVGLEETATEIYLYTIQTADQQYSSKESEAQRNKRLATQPTGKERTLSAENPDWYVKGVYEAILHEFPGYGEGAEMGFFLTERVAEQTMAPLRQMFKDLKQTKYRWILKTPVIVKVQDTQLFPIIGVECTRAGILKVVQHMPPGTGWTENDAFKAEDKAYGCPTYTKAVKDFHLDWWEPMWKAFQTTYPEYGEAAEMGFFISQT